MYREISFSPKDKCYTLHNWEIDFSFIDNFSRYSRSTARKLVGNPSSRGGGKLTFDLAVWSRLPIDLAAWSQILATLTLAGSLATNNHIKNKRMIN